MKKFLRFIALSFAIASSNNYLASSEDNRKSFIAAIQDEKIHPLLDEKTSSTKVTKNRGTEQKFIRPGSTKKEVAYVQGTPKEISNFGHLEIWYFQDGSVIKFTNNKVSGWNNHGSLKVKVADEESTTNTNRLNSSSDRTNQKFYKDKITPPSTAENGSYRGEVSEKTHRQKNTHVRGYYRKDGTYVRGHYRS